MVNGKQVLSLLERTAGYVQANGKKSILVCRPCKLRLNPKKLGYVLPDGTIKFCDTETAIEYGKNKIVKALNSPKPIEVGINIDDSRIIEEFNGTEKDCTFSLTHSPFNISMHGHPDTYAKGCTTAPSIGDYQILMGSKHTREIVFNSRGECYELLKISKANSPLIDDLFANIETAKMIINAFPKHKKEIEAAINSQNLETIREIVEKLIKSPKDLTQTVCEATHKFWVENAERLGVQIRTNFSNFN